MSYITPFEKVRIPTKHFRFVIICLMNPAISLDQVRPRTGLSLKDFDLLMPSDSRLSLAMPSIADRLNWHGQDSLVVVGTAVSRHEIAGRAIDGFTTTGKRLSITTDRRHEAEFIVTIMDLGIALQATESAVRAAAARKEIPGPSGVSQPGGGIGVNFVTCEDDPNQPGCEEPPPNPTPPAGPFVDLGEPCAASGWLYVTRETDKDYDGMRDDCELELARAFEPELLFEAQELHSSREPHFIVEQVGDGVTIGYLLSYYYDGGAVSHNGDSEFILAHLVPWGTRWHLSRITTSAHYGVSFGLDETRTYDWLSYFYYAGYGRARIYVSRSHHGNYNTPWRCNARYGDVCSSAPSDGGFSQFAGKGYNGAWGLQLDKNIGNFRRRLPIDPLLRFGSSPNSNTGCTFADNPAFLGVECYYLDISPATAYNFAGWFGSGGTTSYMSILGNLGLHDGFTW